MIRDRESDIIIHDRSFFMLHLVKMRQQNAAAGERATTLWPGGQTHLSIKFESTKKTNERKNGASSGCMVVHVAQINLAFGTN